MTQSVLVIDDDDHVRRLAVMSLSRVGGYDVRAAASGPEGLAAVDDALPDAIVLDVMMPGMDGPTTLLALRDHPVAHSVPVVFLTAGVVESDLDRLRSLPVSGVLNKPFDPVELPGQLAALLGW
jgi:CheY-like chemotaxis protein